jgi:hypothetical protein
MKYFNTLENKFSTLMLIVMFTFCVTDGYFLEDFEDYAQDPAEDRIFGELPKLNVSTYLNIAMEPHNAMVQVSCSIPRSRGTLE